MLKKLLLSSFDIVDHWEFNPFIVDLFEANDHPEEMGKGSTDFSIVKPFFEVLSAFIGTSKLSKVDSYYLMLYFLIHFLSNFENVAVLRCPFIKEIA